MEKIKVLSYDWDDGCDNAAQSAKRLNHKINLWISKQERKIRFTKPPVVTVAGGNCCHILIILCYEEVGGARKKP